jgi:hypothetical protein
MGIDEHRLESSAARVPQEQPYRHGPKERLRHGHQLDLWNRTDQRTDLRLNGPFDQMDHARLWRSLTERPLAGRLPTPFDER